MSFAEVSILRVPLRRVVATTVELDDPLEDLAFRDLLIFLFILDRRAAQPFSQEDIAGP